MAGDRQIDIGQALKAVKSGTINPVYFLLGDDCFLEQTFIAEIESAFFQDAAVQKTVMIPDEMKNAEIVDRLSASDLFSSKQLFILRKPSSIKSKKIKDEMVEYVAKPHLEKCLIIIVDDWADKSALVTKLKKMVGTINISTPFESHLKKWIYHLFKNHGREQISQDVITALTEVAGDSLYHIANEIEKVCTAVDENEKVTPQDIYKFSGWKRGFQSWQFLTAVGERDLSRSVQIGQNLLMRSPSLTPLVNALANLFQEILYQKIGSGTNSFVRGYTGLSPSITKKLPQFAQGYKRDEIERNLRLLGRIDEEIKTSSVSDEYALTRFLFTGLAARG